MTVKSKNVDLRKRPLLRLWGEVGYQFQKLFQRKKLYQRAAIHESGHVVFSYFYGFTVRECELMHDRPGEGRSETVYGKDAMAATIVFNHLIPEFKKLSLKQQDEVYRKGFHLMLILYAGGCAEAFFKKKPLDKNYDLDIGGGESGVGDLGSINIIEGFYQKIGNPVNNMHIVTNMFGLLEQFEIFKISIEALSKRLIESPNKKLSQSEIEKVLTEVNFFKAREKIMDANSKK